MSRETRVFLETARGAHDAAPGAKDRVRAGLAATLSAGAGSSAGLPQAGSRATWIAGAKVTGIAVVALVGAAWLLGRGSSDGRATSAITPVSAVGSAPVVVLPPARVIASDPTAIARTTGAKMQATASPSPVEAPLVAIEDLPVLSTSAKETPRAATPSVRGTAAPSSASEPPAQESLAAEVALLRRISTSLRGKNPKAALHLVAEHARRFPNGALSEERDVERIAALCALGRDEDAAVATARFEAAYPSSSHDARVRSMCGASAGTAP